MGLRFFEWLAGKGGRTATAEVSCQELLAAAEDFQARQLSFWTCVNMVANAVGRCEVKTFRGREEIQEQEYYLWNVEPNVNQNSSAFWHKLIAKLFLDNEALMISSKRRDGMDAVMVADSWQQNTFWPMRMNEYINVDGLCQSYMRLVAAAMSRYQWERGQHWKVHVNQIASGTQDFEQNFAKIIEQQIKPFFGSGAAVLPEFDGYDYQQVNKTGEGKQSDSRDVRNLIEDIFDFTARGFLIPAVLVNGTVQGTADANSRFLTQCIDAICDQLQEEITRKRYGYEQWERGTYIKVDSSSILHFDMFAEAPNVEKLVGSGAYTINDLRRAANQPEIPEPWADQHYMTKNIAAMSEITRQVDGG